MKIGTEIVIGIVIGVVVTIGLVVGGFFGLVFLVEQGYKKVDQKREQAKVDGREFGKTTDQNACMEKGFLRDEPEYYSNIGFVEECLKSSKPIPDFCDGVPFMDDDKWDKWKDEQCKKVGHNTESCLPTVIAKEHFCKEKKRAQAKVDGREFGKTTDQNSCMEKGFLLEATDRYLSSGFVAECLKSSKPIPDFCDGVPLGYDHKWKDEQCKKVGHNTDSCMSAFEAKYYFCSESNKDKSK